MVTKRLGLVLLGFASVSTPVAATHPNCGDRAKILASLKTEFREERVARGLTKKGAVLEVIASEGGSWTILITYPPPHRRTCMLDAGDAWEVLPLGEQS